MSLGRRQEGEVVAAVGDAGRAEGEREPQPGGADVRAHDERAKHRRQDVGHDVLDRVRIDANDADRCRPLMVLLVDVLVEARVVQESAHR